MPWEDACLQGHWYGSGGEGRYTGRTREGRNGVIDVRIQRCGCAVEMFGTRCTKVGQAYGAHTVKLCTDAGRHARRPAPASQLGDISVSNNEHPCVHAMAVVGLHGQGNRAPG